MKTAMQEFIDSLSSGVKIVLEEQLNKALEKEKEQIMMAFNDGKINSVLKKRGSEEYYNQTYNQNK